MHDDLCQAGLQCLVNPHTYHRRVPWLLYCDRIKLRHGSRQWLWKRVMKAREWPGTSDAPSESPLHCLAIYMRFSWCLPRCLAADTRCQNRAWNLRLPLGCWSENSHTDPFSSPLCILCRCRIFYIFLGTCKQLKFPVGCVLLFAGIMLNTIYIYCRWATMVGYTKRFSSENYW